MSTQNVEDETSIRKKYKEPGKYFQLAHIFSDRDFTLQIYKILRKITEEVLRFRTEKIINGNFRTERSLTAKLFTLKQLLEKCWELNIDMHQIFAVLEWA